MRARLTAAGKREHGGATEKGGGAAGILTGIVATALEYTQIDNPPLQWYNIADGSGQATTNSGSDPQFSNGMFLISGPTDMLIRSSSPMELKIGLESAKNATAHVVSGGFSQDVYRAAGDIVYWT